MTMHSLYIKKKKQNHMKSGNTVTNKYGTNKQLHDKLTQCK